ncbi:ROK family protein [Mycolicibacterium brisbanense]
MSRYLGVDLGGTGTRVVAIDDDGRVLTEITTPTARDVRGGEAVAALVATLSGVAAGAPIGGVGIGASGPVDPTGVIRNPATLPAYTGIPLTRLVGERLGVPCRIDNDAVTAAIGEHRFGAGTGCASMLMVTLGTGIGVAMLEAGQPYCAADGGHPELGHMSVNGAAAQCYCGLTSCWEQVASRSALDELTGGRNAELAAAARSGDGAARAVFHTYGARVGLGMATLLGMFRPELVVVGGSAAQYLDLFGDGLRAQLRRSPEFAWNANVIAARLGNLAGAIGAAAMMLPSSAVGGQAITRSGRV